jgi:hypothetical protein
MPGTLISPTPTPSSFRSAPSEDWDEDLRHVHFPDQAGPPLYPGLAEGSSSRSLNRSLGGNLRGTNDRPPPPASLHRDPTSTSYDKLPASHSTRDLAPSRLLDSRSAKQPTRASHSEASLGTNHSVRGRGRYDSSTSHDPSHLDDHSRHFAPTSRSNRKGKEVMRDEDELDNVDSYSDLDQQVLRDENEELEHEGEFEEDRPWDVDAETGQEEDTVELEREREYQAQQRRIAEEERRKRETAELLRLEKEAKEELQRERDRVQQESLKDKNRIKMLEQEVQRLKAEASNLMSQRDFKLTQFTARQKARYITN